MYTEKIKNKNYTTAFTLIELLVVVSIVVVVSTIVLANYSKFNSNIVLENVAYDVGLSVRQAQTYGMTVKEFGVGSGVFPAYGAHFYTGGSGGSEFYIFADTSGSDDKIYNATGCTPGVDECVEKYMLQNSYSIYTLCGDLKKDSVALPNDPARNISDFATQIGDHCGNIDKANIAFTRPDPDALLTVLRAGSPEVLEDLEIIVASPRGDVRTIVVWSTGQISIE